MSVVEGSTESAPMELAESEANEESYSRVSTEPRWAAKTSSWSTCCSPCSSEARPTFT